jgi:hypothetical protein
MSKVIQPPAQSATPIPIIALTHFLTVGPARKVADSGAPKRWVAMYAAREEANV